MAKKQAKKVAKKDSQKHEIIVRVESQSVPSLKDIEKPIVDGGKYMIPKTWISEKQIIRLVGKTPANCVYTRPGKGGQSFQYVTGSYVDKVLNFTFGWNWDFEVVQHGKEGNQVWVHGKLTVKDDLGHSIIKSQFGRSEIKMLKNGTGMVDFGNDLKSATTDALKKCASLLGIASDIYGKNEFKQETGVNLVEQNNVQQVEEEVMSECHECGDPINQQVAEYSKKIFGKPLCRAHQLEAKKK